MAGHKYGAKRTVVDGYTFASAAEARHFVDLRLLQKAGAIVGLELQPVYELAPAVVLGKRKKPALRYVADFRYFDTRLQQQVVVDVKGVVTEAFRIKQHLMATVHGIQVQVVK